MSTYIRAVDLEHKSFWMESFWSPKKCRLVGGLRVTFPSGRLQRLLMHPVNNEFGPKQFTCIHQFHPRLCHCPLASPCQCQPTGETVPSTFGPLEIAVFASRAAHVTEPSLPHPVPCSIYTSGAPVCTPSLH